MINQGPRISEPTMIGLLQDGNTPLNGVRRLRYSDQNYCGNGSMESWSLGTTSAPNGWTIQGTATIARDATAFTGTYSALVTFGAAIDGEFYTTFPASSLVDYTFSAYVTRTAGTGSGRFVMQQNFGGFNEEVTVSMPTGAGQQLVALTGKPVSDGVYRLNFKANDLSGSTWRIDEVKIQESKGVASAWTPAVVDDSYTQTIYAFKTFLYGAQMSGDLIISTKTPATAGATGTAGTIAWDSSFIYICVATNTWKRIGIATW